MSRDASTSAEPVVAASSGRAQAVAGDPAEFSAEPFGRGTSLQLVDVVSSVPSPNSCSSRR